MSRSEAIKTWIRTNVPLLAQVYQNKYIGMVYDRFASLSVRRQKQLILGFFGSIVFIVSMYLISSYWSLWSRAHSISQYHAMTELLQDYQEQQQQQSGDFQNLEKNAQLAAPGQLKDFLVGLGRTAGISPRMLQVEEKPDEGGAASQEGAKIRSASARLEKVNLRQLKAFIQAIENSEYSFSITKVHIANDDKLRGYMNADLTVSAYIFENTEGVIE